MHLYKIANVQQWKSEKLNQFHKRKSKLCCCCHTHLQWLFTHWITHYLALFHWGLGSALTNIHTDSYTWPHTDQPKSIMSSTVVECIMVDVTGRIHKGGWQRILILSCSCLVALLSPVILLLQMSHLLLAWQGWAVLMMTAAICSLLGNLSGPQQQ